MDIEQMPENPQRHHRRSHSDTSFRFPNLDDLLFFDGAELDLSILSSPSPSPTGGAPMAVDSADSRVSDDSCRPKPEPSVSRPLSLGGHLRSLSMDSNFFENLGLAGDSGEIDPLGRKILGDGKRPVRHRHSLSMDGSSSSFEADSAMVMDGVKNSMDPDKLAELALIDPKRAKSFMSKRQKRYGKVFKTSVLGRITVFMTGSDASKILLTGKDGMVSLNLFYTGQQVLGRSSLLQMNGEGHKRLRRLIAEPLSVDGLKKCFQFINTLAIETLDKWPGRTVLVHEEVSSFTLKVIGNMIMSLEPCGEELEKFRANFKQISSCFSSLPLNIPGTAFYRGMKARERMFAMLDSIIAKRRSGEVYQQDFLESLVMKHSKRGGGRGGETDEDKLTDTQLKDNILTLLIAGHDTTTAALTWLIKFLGENPDALEKLRIEHRQIQAKREGGDLTWAEANNLPYTAKVISETLRKATILPWYSRKAAQDFEIEGYKIKKGWSVNLDVISIHHDARVFPEPEKFNPSRFEAPLKPFSYLGFGSGPRMCPGINLAKLELSIFIHHLVCKYKWRSLDDDDSMQATLVRMPKNKYPITVDPL